MSWSEPPVAQPLRDPHLCAARGRGFEPCRRQNRSGGAILGEKALRAMLERPMRSMVEGASLRTLVRSMLLAAALTATTAHLADIALSAITATIVATSSGFTLTWTAAPGKTYTVEACEDLSIGDWLPIPNATGLTNGSYTDSVISPSRKFYRIVVQ